MIVCDASHNGLGALLEQLSTEGWRPILFASRYLNDAEKRYSTNRSLGEEYLRSYVLGKKLLSIIKRWYNSETELMKRIKQPLVR